MIDLRLDHERDLAGDGTSTIGAMFADFADGSGRLLFHCHICGHTRRELVAPYVCPVCRGATPGVRARLASLRATGREFREARRRLGIGLRQAAGRLGVSLVVLGEMERGARPIPSDALERLERNAKPGAHSGA